MVVPLALGLSKRYKFTITMTNTEDEEDKTPPPFIAVQVGQEKLQTYAFIDSGADGNTISYELFKQIKNLHLSDTDAVFRSYTGHMTRALGMCKLELNVSELICGDKFFVTLPDMQDEPIILGRTWQRKYNYFIDWSQRLAHCQSSDNRVWVPL